MNSVHIPYKSNISSTSFMYKWNHFSEICFIGPICPLVGPIPLGLRWICNSIKKRLPWSDCPLKGSDWARRIDTDGQKWTHFDSGGSIGGIYGTDQNFMVPTNLVLTVVGPGRGTWDWKNQEFIEK